MNFDNKAAGWDSEDRIMRAKKISSEITKNVRIDNTVSALEFGCGTGLVSFNLYGDLKHITLADTSEKMIEVSKTKIKAAGANNMEAIFIDAEGLLGLNKHYDLIYTSMVLHHIKDTKMIIEGFYKLLNKKGQLCIVDLDTEDGSFHGKDFEGHFGFDQKELSSVLKNAGFKDVESYTFIKDKKKIENNSMNYSLFIMCAKK